jgi:hypothetical protein
MPITPYIDQLEPADASEIWRFMKTEYFRDLMANEELYFRRSDLFPQDLNEGIPPEEYLRLVMGLDRYLLNDEKQLNHQMGSLAQFREMYYVNCWHLFRAETPKMWREFAQDGLAICSRYELLKSALNGMLDETHLGLVRYGDKHLTQTMRINTLQFISTKRIGYAGEYEVRAFLQAPDPFAGNNRHFDRNNWPHRLPLSENPRHPWVHEYKRRRIELKSLITGIVVSPWASKEVFAEVEQWVTVKQHSYTVRPSDLTGSLSCSPK